jgi:hypothetical protein
MPHVLTVSRDFTSTSASDVVARKVQELLFLLQQAGRAFHVLVVGTGPVSAPLILRALAAAGHTATIVTSAPIMKAQSGGRYEFAGTGELLAVASDPDQCSFVELIEHNLALFEQRLFAAVAGTRATATALPNGYW